MAVQGSTIHAMANVFSHIIRELAMIVGQQQCALFDRLSTLYNVCLKTLYKQGGACLVL